MNATSKVQSFIHEFVARFSQLSRLPQLPNPPFAVASISLWKNAKNDVKTFFRLHGAICCWH